MKTSDFDYELPQELIAQTPIEPRDHSRLLVYDRADRSVRHLHFYDLPQFLHAGDALVINETKVIPARLLGQKEDTGVPVEVLLLREPPDVPVMLVPIAMAPAPTAPPRSEQHSASATTRPAVCFFFGCVCSGCCGIW